MRITVIGPAYPLRGGIAHHVYCLKNGLRCIVECHNVFPHESTPLDRLLLKFALRPADAFITHSREEEADLLPLVPGKRITVASLPTPSEFFGGTNHARDGRTILFFGKVRKYKGLDVLLAAMPKVLSQINCQLLIVGEFYDSIERYRQLIHRLELEPHVQIDNRYVPNEEVVGIFDRADVLVLPYLSATQSAVAQIALRNGLPVIASRTGGLSEVVIENVNGLLFPPGDSNALADKIISYFSNNSGPAFAENIISSSATPREELGQVIEDLVRVDLNSASLWKSSGVRDLA